MVITESESKYRIRGYVVLLTFAKKKIACAFCNFVASVLWTEGRGLDVVWVAFGGGAGGCKTRQREA